MEAHVARQPILDESGETFAYELLFRSSSTQNWAALTGQRRAFINLTRQALLERWVLALPAAQTVAEVLETVSPDAEVLAAHGAEARGLRAGARRLRLRPRVRSSTSPTS